MTEEIILVAEDNRNDAYLLQWTFRQVGLPILMVIVVDGEHAIQYLAGRDPYAEVARYPLPALLLLDLKMPRCSGFNVLSWVE